MFHESFHDSNQDYFVVFKEFDEISKKTILVKYTFLMIKKRKRSKKCIK